MNFHNINTMSVKHCQEMITTGNYLMICRSKTFNPITRIKAIKKYSGFIEKLQELFGNEDFEKLIGIDILIQGMRLKRNNLTLLHDGLKLCYDIKDTPRKIQLLDGFKEKHRLMLFRYPSVVDAEAEADEQKKQIDDVLKPIKSEIERLDYKIKEKTPLPNTNEVEKEDKQLGLAMHIAFIEAVENNGYLDRDITVNELKFKYDQAVQKNNKLKVKQDGR